MRENIGLYRGKAVDNGKWIEGFYCPVSFGYFPCRPAIIPKEEMDNGCWRPEEIIPETLGEYTGLTDKNGKKIFEGDIVQYNTFDDFDCQSVVKFGSYKQDGSGGEYRARECIGFYVEVDNFTCPDWADNEPWRFNEYLEQQNLLEVAESCVKIGNIYDNPEIVKGGSE